MNTTKETGLTREDIQKHIGYLIKTRREDLAIPAQDFIDKLKVGSRKTLWEWEVGKARPRDRHMAMIEELLGFRRNSLTELFRLVGSRVDITELRVSDLVEQPRKWREPSERDTLAEASAVVLVQELVSRLRDLEDENAALRKELQGREGGRRFYDLAADDSPFKAALERETGQ